MNGNTVIKVGVVGATGYTARQLFKILLRHPNVQVVRATSRQETGCVSSQHPGLLGELELPLSNFDIQDFVDTGVECAFSCLPHAASAATAKALLVNGIKIVDFSADYRLNDWETFEHWYDVEHPDRERVGSVPYGLPELFRDQIIDQSLVANPGCFPTTAILAIAPLVASSLIEYEDIIVDSKSGVSGAGRTPKPNLHFPECNDSVTAYGVGTHRHGPEIEHIVRRKTGQSISVIFTPHLIPMDRGILSTIYLRPRPGVDHKDIERSLSEAYEHEPFVRIAGNLRTTKSVTGTNYCDLTVRKSGNTVIVISTIDNLMKGASGAAVQNFNLMHGFPESTGLKG